MNEREADISTFRGYLPLRPPESPAAPSRAICSSPKGYLQ